MTSVQRTDFAHFVPVNTRWGDMDTLGHVNNTVFYQYSEEGRINYFTDILGIGASGDTSGPILADLRCSFIQQLRHPTQLEIGTRTTRIGRSSMQIQQALYRKGEDAPAAMFEAVVVWFDYPAQRSTAVPEAMRQRIADAEVADVEV